ncbi:hypothetical protein NW759_016769 [Fusarium solani]|nr:hypothetical protein NW759_016769 [Fusarium solani]
MSIRTFNGFDPNYTTLGVLGSGAFGTVTKVQRKADGKVVACKSMRFTADKVDLIRREIIVLRALVGCRNVVQWMEDISYDVASNQIHLHMVYYPDGTLESFIKSQNGLVPKDTVIQIFCCMAMALLDCHSRGIIHRDIKPANILLSKGMWNGQPTTIAYLADFGIGKFSISPLMPGGGLAGTLWMGTPLYMAPESFNMPNSYYGSESDIFSLGCVMYELCNLQNAYTGFSRTYVPLMKPAAALAYGSRLTPLIARCLALEPNMRINTADLVTSLQVYCATRWQKKVVGSMWTSLAVKATTGALAAKRQAPHQAPYKLPAYTPPIYPGPALLQAQRHAYQPPL